MTNIRKAINDGIQHNPNYASNSGVAVWQAHSRPLELPEG
jgi:hypothetical protein